MKKLSRSSLLFSTIVLLAGVVGVIGYMQGYLGNSLKRISREHSVNLPNSSAMEHCDGFVSLTSFGDFGATADFVVKANHVGDVLGQINESKEGALIKDRRLNWDYEVPKGFGRELRYVEGVSREGNIVTVTLYELDGQRVGVCLRTQWN